jgi:hypothetical protein
MPTAPPRARAIGEQRDFAESQVASSNPVWCSTKKLLFTRRMANCLCVQSLGFRLAVDPLALTGLVLSYETVEYWQHTSRAEIVLGGEPDRSSDGTPRRLRLLDQRLNERNRDGAL